MMKVFRSSQAAARTIGGCALAIGNFDGVHLGHQALLERTLLLARQHDLSALALTFEPHPARFFRPEAAPLLINTEEQKLALLGHFGLDGVVVEPFNTQLAQLTAEQFIEERLVDRLHARHVVVGKSFVFGHGRGGNIETMAAEGRRLAFQVHGVETVQLEGQPVSSTRVRECIRSGDVATARWLMGRPFVLDGRVVSGAGRGRTIGIPTANLEPNGRLLPARGVYAAQATIEGNRTFPTVVNVGCAPTFETQSQTRVEAHLLDFVGELTQQHIEVAFIEHLRAERRFSGAEELVAAIQCDIKQARQIFGTQS